MQPDITYYNSGLFTVFLPETIHGESAWNELARKSDGTGKFLRHQAVAVVTQLRAAGYVVRLQKPVKVKPGEIDSLYAALMA